MFAQNFKAIHLIVVDISVWSKVVVQQALVDFAILRAMPLAWLLNIKIITGHILYSH